jgi:hypothetical protein
MEKIRAITTLKLLKNKDACSDGYQTLIDYLGKDYPEEKEINLLTILESNGIDHCLWAFRATTVDTSKQARLIAADCAESVLYIYQEKYPDDNRPELSIKAARDFANGLISSAPAYAASASAYAAASAAYTDSAYASDAASAAAYASAYASDAAYAAAYASAAAYAAASRQKEREKQIEIIKKYLEV